MLKIVPDPNYLPTLSALEQNTIENFNDYFNTVQKDSDVTLYVHPDTINADIDMVLDNRIEYRKSVFHQLWLVNVADSHDQAYDRTIWDEAEAISKFKTGLLWNKAFNYVEYPDWLKDEYKFSYDPNATKKLTLKQRFAINTLIIADRQQLDNQIEQLANNHQKDAHITNYLQTHRVADLCLENTGNYIKLAHTVWVDEMTADNRIFSEVMSPRSNAWTALTPGEYDIAKYFIGFNLANENMKAPTGKVLGNPNLAALVEDTTKERVAVRGLAKTGKTTLLIMRALCAAQQGEKVTITSYTYANLARIRLMLQALSQGEGTLRLQGITLQTVSSIIHLKDPLESNALYIDNAEDISEDELKALFNAGNFNDIFVTYNPYQQVIFNRNSADTTAEPSPSSPAQVTKDKNWPLNEDIIKVSFYVVSIEAMVNDCAYPIKMVYQDFLDDYTNVALSNPDNQGKPAIFIRDDVAEKKTILTEDELQIIKGAIDKQYQASNISTNGRFVTTESQNIAIVSSQFSPLVQVSMFLNHAEEDKKQGRSFLTYKEIIDQSQNQALKSAVNDEMPFEELLTMLIKQVSPNQDSHNLESISTTDIEKVRKFINTSKSNYSRNTELNFHRFLPAMMNRLILSTLESFKGLQAEVLVAILPADDKFKLGNYTTILSSAKSKLIIINRSEKFHEFIESERNKRKHFHNDDRNIICF